MVQGAASTWKRILDEVGALHSAVPPDPDGEGGFGGEEKEEDRGEGAPEFAGGESEADAVQVS